MTYRIFAYLILLITIEGYTSTLREQRTLFLQAETALAKGQTNNFQQLKKRLKDYPLYPYLLFAEFEKHVQSMSENEFQHFVRTYPNTPLSKQLRTRWLYAKAKDEQWSDFLKAYAGSNDIQLQCLHLNAQLNTTASTQHKTIIDRVGKLWLTGKETPKHCQNVFKLFERSPNISRSLLWQKIKLSIQEGNDRQARHLSKKLPREEIALVELWIMVNNNPYLITHPQYFTSQHAAILEMLVHGASLIAKTKPETAIQIWQKISPRHPFTERHWGLVVRAIGLSYALQKNIAAEKWLNKVPEIYANDLVYEWRVRIALTQENWQNVLSHINNLPNHLLQKEEWQYWHARALDMLGRSNEAQSLFTTLATHRSYYGFMASQQLMQQPTVSNKKLVLESSFIKEIAQKAGIARAYELQALGRNTKAYLEWRNVTEHMNDKERHAAAAIALTWDLPNWSIIALSHAKHKDHLELRFPLLHTAKITAQAEKLKIDPAWIFAVARQESAFVSTARSSAGALGLMQLIPTTAKMVAKYCRVPFKNADCLLEPHTNIHLGSSYLKMMLEEHSSNPVLATAAYNAGPGRIKKWLPSSDMAADTWIETIPYRETREYVRNVMTYTVIYQQLLGRKPRLSALMPYVPGNR